MQEQLVKNAKTLAQRSNLKHQHASIIFDKQGKIISAGYNQPHAKSIASIHAEQAAIGKSIKSKLNSCAYGILVIRMSSKGKLKLSAPCEKCREAINQHNLCIYYTDDDDEGNQYLVKEQMNGNKKSYPIAVVNFLMNLITRVVQKV